jgi:hypothetical protein
VRYWAREEGGEVYGCLRSEGVLADILRWGRRWRWIWRRRDGGEAKPEEGVLLSWLDSCVD